nr:very long-chain specific acyl-CoA dehydrogenase, mitochondrial-like [Cherax quadricarinatus]
MMRYNKLLWGLSRINLAMDMAPAASRLQSTVAEPASSGRVSHRERNITKKEESKSFVMNIFRGSAVTEQAIPFPDILTEEQKETLEMLIGPTEKFFRECNDAAKNDSIEAIEEQSMQSLRELGAFGLQVPVEYGGVGLNNTQYTRLVEIVGYNDLGVGITLGAHQSIGFKGIMITGTPEQKAKYLPKVATGEHIAAFALTEPSSGSDAGSIRSRAVLAEDGSHYVLNGSKIWISNGGLAEVFTVFAQSPFTDPKTGLKIIICNFNSTCCCFYTCAVIKVLTILQYILLTVLLSFLQEKLSRMAMLHYVSESMTYMISSNMDAGSKDYHLEAAISKCFASEAAWTVTDEAIQVMGGMGFMKETGLERVLRDLRIFRIFEGTNDILRLFVALTGLQYAGGHLRELQQALKNPAANMGLILGEGTKRAKRAIGFTNNGTIEGIHPKLSDSALLLGRAVEAFGYTAEGLLMKHGKSIIDQQFLLNRLANSCIDLYASLVVLSRASRSLNLNLLSSDHEEKIARVWVNEASDRIQLNLTAVKSSVSQKNFSDLEAIAKELSCHGNIIAERPLGF